MSEDRLSLGGIGAGRYLLSGWRGLLLTLILTILLIMGFEKTAHAAFTGTNGKIAFASDRGDGLGGEIYTMDADGSNQINISKDPANDGDPNWSPDGKKIVFVKVLSFNAEIYTMDADGSNLVRLTDNPADEFSPVWSPDGTKIAFRSTRDGNAEIYVMNVDGSGETNLTNNPSYDDEPTWSPDSSKIAFASGRDGNMEIYVMNADGSNLKNLTNTPPVGDNGKGEGSPAWSPDGTKIAFMGCCDGYSTHEIYVMNADGGERKNLTNSETGEQGPDWSPDGKQIVFMSYGPPQPNHNYEISVMNADGTGRAILSNAPTTQEFSPSWQPLPTTDNLPPDTTIDSGPSGTVKTNSASFAFSSSEDGSTFRCSLDGAVFSTCTSPTEFTNLSNGTHTFEVQAIDLAGNVGPKVSRSWTVDTVLPTITDVAPKNGSIISNQTPTIKATVRDNITLQKSNIELYVNGILIDPAKYSYNPETGALVYNSPKLSKGKKTVKIVATDTAKNVSSKSWTFTIK